jgi:hypothetical protein
MTDGPFVEGKEHIGGVWVIEAPDLDAALAWAARATAACRQPVEVRPFQAIPPEARGGSPRLYPRQARSRRSSAASTGAPSLSCAGSPVTSMPPRKPWPRPSPSAAGPKPVCAAKPGRVDHHQIASQSGRPAATGVNPNGTAGRGSAAAGESGRRRGNSDRGRGGSGARLPATADLPVLPACPRPLRHRCPGSGDQPEPGIDLLWSCPPIQVRHEWFALGGDVVCISRLETKC